MLDLDLLYVKARQHERWQEAANCGGRPMEQEKTSLRETDNISTLSSIAGDSNRAATALPTPTRAQTDAFPALTTEELVRYDRHLMLPQVGVEGQRKLKAASILLRVTRSPACSPPSPVPKPASSPAPV